MAFDYFTLNALVAELREHLVGEKVNWVRSDCEGLAFSCRKLGFVRARVGPRGFLCWVAERPPDLASGPLGPERYVLGARVEDLWWNKRDRIVHFRLSRKGKSAVLTYGQLICELIRPHCQICLIREQNSEVLGQWAATVKNRSPRIAVGRIYAPPPAWERILPGQDDFAQFKAKAMSHDGTVQELLSQALVAMDRNLAADLLYRTGLSQEVSVVHLGQDGLEKIWSEAVGLYAGEIEAKGYYWESEGRGDFSALEPVSRTGLYSVLPSISEAIQRVHQNPDPETEKQSGRDLQRSLKRIRKNLTHKLRNLRGDLEEADEAEEFARKGNNLLAQLGGVKRGSSQVELPDIYDISGSTLLKIDMDPGRSPVENAKRFLKTAKKYQRRRQVIPGRIEAIIFQLGEVEKFIANLNAGEESSFAAIEKWLAERDRGPKMKKPREKGVERAHPRRYRTSQGWSVWAGRNNRENDQLTHRLASQNDYWFHAHGYAGAHVVLRREDRDREPGAKNLAEAAAIAAYWSKGKTAKKVPVVYTLVKYVSKPRGGQPGQALMRREKTLVVEPALLAEEDSPNNSA